MLYRKEKLDDALERMKIAEVCVRDDTEITGLRAAIDSLAVVNSSKELASEQERADMMYYWFLNVLPRGLRSGG